MSTRPKLLIVLAAAAAALVILAPWQWGAARVAVPIVGESRPAPAAVGVERSPVGAGPRRVALAAPPEAPATAPSGPAAEPGPPPALLQGDLRIVGRVTVDDELAVELAGSVRVHLGDPSEAHARLLGTCPVRAGRFGLDVQGSELGPDDDTQVVLTLVAPGFLISSGVVRRPLEGGVLSIRLDTSPGSYLVRGRVVTPDGAPVPFAHVLVAAFGPLGASLESVEEVTERDGSFRATVRESGFVDVVAHHQAHGVAKAGGTLRITTPLLDLGDLVLAPLGVIEGTLRGSGGAPLRRYGVTVTPVDEDSDLAGHEVRTDDAGRFRLACLQRVDYRVEAFAYDRADIEWPVVTPDALDVDVTVPIPSARVTVIGPDGAPAREADLSVASLRRDDDGRGWGVGGQGTVTLEAGDPGTFHLTFSQRGRFSLGAVSYRDGQRWVAQEQIDVGVGSAEVRLQLAPEHRRELPVVVQEPGGAAAQDWRVSFIDPRTGLHGSLVRSRAPLARLAEGRWLARVSPVGAGAMILPFEQELEVRDDTDRIALVAERLGGRLTVTVDFAAPRQLKGRVRIAGQGRGLSVAEGQLASFGELLEPGDHELWIQGAEPTTRRGVTIRAGETTHVRVAVP